MNDFTRWRRKLSSIIVDLGESLGLGILVGLGAALIAGLFGGANLGGIVGGTAGGLYAMASFWRRRDNLKKPSPVEYQVS